MRSSIVVAVFLTAFVSAKPAPAPPKDLVIRQSGGNPQNIMMFLCNDIPEVCTNMCYGAFCEDNGQSLTYDKPSASVKRSRRRAAKCAPNPNRCSTKKGYAPGFQCDEYPFASTVTTGMATPVRLNRCVPSQQNSKQGGTINKFYQGAYCGGGPCDFTVGFSNAGNVNYCGVPFGSGNCDNDGNEELGSGGDQKRDLVSYNNATSLKYKLASGGEIMVPGGAQIGQLVWSVKPLNQSLWDEQTESHIFDEEAGEEQFGYMEDNLDLEGDSIVEVIHGG